MLISDSRGDAAQDQAQFERRVREEVERRMAALVKDKPVDPVEPKMAQDDLAKDGARRFETPPNEPQHEPVTFEPPPAEDFGLDLTDHDEPEHDAIDVEAMLGEPVVDVPAESPPSPSTRTNTSKKRKARDDGPEEVSSSERERLRKRLKKSVKAAVEDINEERRTKKSKTSYVATYCAYFTSC